MSFNNKNTPIASSVNKDDIFIIKRAGKEYEIKRDALVAGLISNKVPRGSVVIGGSNNQATTVQISGDAELNESGEFTVNTIGGNALSAVAFSGDYSDLINVPTNLSDFNNDVGFITSLAFTGLTDAPNSYATNSLKGIRVNAGETGLEFYTISAVITSFTGLSDVPNSYTGQSLKYVRVNAGETALEFAAFPTNVSTFTNDSGYITSSALSPYLTSTTAALTYVPLIRSLTIDGTSYDLSSDRTWTISRITSLNGLTNTTQTFANDTNVTITSAVSTHTIGWSGQLSVSRGGTGLSTVGGTNTILYTSTADNITSSTNLVYNSSLRTNKVYIGATGTAPTALLHLAAGTSAINTAPIKLSPGIVNFTPENGAIEFDGASFFYTIGSTRYAGLLGFGVASGTKPIMYSSDTTNVLGASSNLSFRASGGNYAVAIGKNTFLYTTSALETATVFSPTTNSYGHIFSSAVIGSSSAGTYSVVSGYFALGESSFNNANSANQSYRGLEAVCSVAGLGSILNIETSGYLIGNSGSTSRSTATTTGYNIGSYNEAYGGNLNVGVLGKAIVTKNNATNIGGIFNAINAGTSPVIVGLFAGTVSSTPSFTSAALLVDNGSQTINIATFRDNGSIVMQLIDGGNLFIGGSTTPTAKVHIAAGSATANTAPLQFTSGTYETAARAGLMEYNGQFSLTPTDGTRRYVTLAASSTKTTAAAPYANDGYITVNINGTDIKLMTTA